MGEQYEWEAVSKDNQDEDTFVIEQLITYVAGKWGLGKSTVAQLWENKKGEYTLVTYEDGGDEEEREDKYTGTYVELKSKAESIFG